MRADGFFGHLLNKAGTRTKLELNRLKKVA